MLPYTKERREADAAPAPPPEFSAALPYRGTAMPGPYGGNEPPSLGTFVSGFWTCAEPRRWTCAEPRRIGSGESDSPRGLPDSAGAGAAFWAISEREEP